MDITENGTVAKLDELRPEVERLLDMIDHQEPGLFTWVDDMRDQITKVRDGLNEVLGPQR